MSSNNRLDCWEFQGCERGPGGRRSAEGGPCPAGTAKSLDGEHGGHNGGRACWIVTGTLCGGRRSGTFSTKIHECRKCAFYARVHVEDVLVIKADEDLLDRYCSEHGDDGGAGEPGRP